MTAPAFEAADVTANTPDFTRPDVGVYARARKRGQDLMAGTDAIHAAGEKYLPKWANEDHDLYHVRSTLTEVYGAFQRCVSAARGLVGAKPPTLPDSAPEQLKQHWTDITGDGTHGEVFAMRVFEEGIVDGVVALLVDYPSYDESVATLEDHQKKGLRPYWVLVCSDQIINWRWTKVGGKAVLSMVTIHEEVDEDVGEFGVVCVSQYRTIRLERVDGGNGTLANAITWQIRRKRVEGNKEVWYVSDEGQYRGPSRIPLAIGYLGRRTAPFVADPPLAALSELNIGHYRVSSDRRYLMSIVHAPTFVLEGWTDPVQSSENPLQQNSGVSSEISLGPNSVLKTPPDCVAKWVQADPNGLDSSKAEKDDLVAQMGSMSIAFLAQERKAQETATAHRINSIAQNATLATAARGLKDLLDDALEIHGEYLAVTEPVEATVNTTYDEDALDAPTITALNQMAADNNITRRTLLTILQRGNIIPDDIDLDDEVDELDAQHRDANGAIADGAARAHLLIAGAAKGGNKPSVKVKYGADGRPESLVPQEG